MAQQDVDSLIQSIRCEFNIDPMCWPSGQLRVNSMHRALVCQATSYEADCFILPGEVPTRVIRSSSTKCIEYRQERGLEMRMWCESRRLGQLNACERVARHNLGGE